MSSPYIQSNSPDIADRKLVSSQCAFDKLMKQAAKEATIKCELVNGAIIRTSVTVWSQLMAA